MGTVRVAFFYFFQVITSLIVARALLSWFIRDARNPIMQALYALTEPILAPIRGLLVRLGIGGTMMDFSPLVAVLLLQILTTMLI